MGGSLRILLQKVLSDLSVMFDRMDTDVRKSLRLSADLSDRIDGARGRESWSGWVKRQLELALDSDGGSSITREMYESPLLEEQLREPSLSTSAGRSAVYERIGALVEQETAAGPSKAGSSKGSSPAVPMFCCPIPGCDFRVTGAGAYCLTHSRKVRPCE